MMRLIVNGRNIVFLCKLGNSRLVARDNAVIRSEITGLLRWATRSFAGAQDDTWAVRGFLQGSA